MGPARSHTDNGRIEGERLWLITIWSFVGAPSSTARAPRHGIADVAIKDGRIAAVGKVAGRGREEIDASGLSVDAGLRRHPHPLRRPGDVGSSSSPRRRWHGVTTAVMGNCGVGFAPVRPERPRAADRADGRRRGHPRCRCLHEGLTGTGRASPNTSTRWSAAATTSISARSCRTRRARLRHGRARCATAKPATEADRTDAQARRGWAKGRRAWLLDLAHHPAQDPRRQS